MTDARYTYTAGMPAARVGWLVARARAVAGIGERDLASTVGVPVRTVRKWERGDLVPTDDEVEAIASACGARLTELLPRRTTVMFDTATGLMQIGDQAVSIPLTSLDNDTVLAAFVALVRRVRGLRLDQDVKVRQEDLDALGEMLDVDDNELEERLVRIIGMSRTQAAAVRAQLLRRRLAVPMVGMLASLSLLGANRLFTTGSEQVKAIDGEVDTRPPAPTTTSTTIVLSPDSSVPAVAVLLAPPSSAGPATSATTAADATPPPTETLPPVATSAFIGPRVPGQTAQTGPPRSSSPKATTAPVVTDPPVSPEPGTSPATSPTTQVTAAPVTTSPTTALPPPTTSGPIGTDHTTGTPAPPPPPTTTSTTPPPPPTTTTSTTRQPPPPTTTATTGPVGTDHTTETNPSPPTTKAPASPVGGIGTTGGTTGSA